LTYKKSPIEHIIYPSLDRAWLEISFCIYKDNYLFTFL